MLDVPRAEFAIEDPWRVPAGAARVELRRATDGAAPRLATSCALYHDGKCFTAVFLCEDDGVVATYTVHDEPLWKEDVVELFVAPARLTRYYEIEVNPIGTTFDAAIDSPDLERRTMRTDLGWTCEGLFVAVRTTPASLDVVIRMPFAAFGGAAREWRANLFRVDRSERGDEYSAWMPAMKKPADFHVPEAFGVLRFG